MRLGEDVLEKTDLVEQVGGTGLQHFASDLALVRLVTFEHDATWMATALAGAIVGLLRGRRIAVETDQVWGTVRMPAVYDTVIAAFCIFAIASADGLSGLFEPGTLPRHAHMAAASALFAGYLAGRAWSLMRRAVRSPHTELER